MDVIVTRHAEERLKERLGLNKKSCARIAQKAYDMGITHTEKSGTLNKYLKHKERQLLEGTDYTSAKVYGEYIFIFAHNVLVTTMELPNALKKHVKR